MEKLKTLLENAKFETDEDAADTFTVVYTYLVNEKLKNIELPSDFDIEVYMAKEKAEITPANDNTREVFMKHFSTEKLEVKF